MADEFKFEFTNLNLVLGQLKQKVDIAEKAARYALGQVALAVEREAKLNAATGTHRPGEPTSAVIGSGPNIITGNLNRSIHTEIKGFGGGYEALVGPTMVYARAVELFPDGSERYPYLGPAGRKIKPKANQIFLVNFRKIWR